MEQKRTYTFEELPSVMAEVMFQLRTLTEKVESLSGKESKLTENQPPRTVFVPSHKNTLNTRSLCKLLHLNNQAIYRMVAAGEIPYFKQGKNLGFFEDEVYRWMEERRGETNKTRSNLEAAAREYCINNSL